MGGEMRLGVDFGTTRTVVSAVERGRYPVAAFETPAGFVDYLSGLAVLAEGKLHFGHEARSYLDGASVLAIQSVKRALAGLAPDDPVPGLVGVNALDLATRYLEYVRRRVLYHSNLDVPDGEPLEVVVAVPANAGTRQRYLTLEAFSRAGFHVLGMVNEPTAAAIEYAHRNLGAIGRRSPKRYVVVYDLGGGTFDTSAVSLEGRRFELLASEGIAKLGGNDFDEVLMELALEATGVAPGALSSGKRAALLEVCREAKETLGQHTKRLLIDCGTILPGQEAIVVEASRFYERTEPMIEQTLDLIASIFQRLDGTGIDPANPRELGALYLVGGSTSFPAVARVLRRAYGRKLLLAPQPHAATAVGLAIAADADAELFVVEAVTRHFGVWREAEQGREKYFDAIFRKDTASDEALELTVQRNYRPVHRVGHLRFVECSRLTEDGQPTGDLTPWGEFLFPYDPTLADSTNLAGRAGERTTRLADVEILETYRYSRDGSVSVEIENRTHGYRRAFVVSQQELRPLGGVQG